jgi:hypothetical protein
VNLKSALQDVRETTLAAISGLLAKLAYLGSLRRKDGEYRHWGMSSIHGEDSSSTALATAHAEVLSTVLRAPISQLVEDLKESSKSTGQSVAGYAEALHQQLDQLLPASPDQASSSHLNSVLVALSNLENTQERATPSAS